MTLGRKLIIGTSFMIASTVAVSVAALWVLNGMTQKLHWIAEEFEEMEMVDRITLNLVRADSLLSQSEVNVAELQASLGAAREGLEHYVEEQHEEGVGSEEHQASEADQASQILAELKQIDQALSANQEGGAVHQDTQQAWLASLRVMADQVHVLAEQTEAVVIGTDKTIDEIFTRSATVLGGIALSIILAGITCGTLLYKTIMTPIQKLHHRVRKFDNDRADHSATSTLASGKESTPPASDVMTDLNTSFNGMVDELDSLYRDLEQRVETKSRQLIQAERLSSIGYLAAGVAHEINNPLNAMMGYSELALKSLHHGAKPPHDQDPVEALTIIRNEAFRCKAITEKLLSLSRQSNAEKSPVDLRQVVGDVQSMVVGLRHLDQQRLRLELPPEAPLLISGVEAELKQVLLNLVINALEATEKPEGQVIIQATCHDGNISLAISDNGKGIAQEEIGNVFQPFYTTKRGKGEGGTGLGLSIVYAIIKDHNGQISAHSHGSGLGSRFDILFPAYRDEVAT